MCISSMRSPSWRSSWPCILMGKVEQSQASGPARIPRRPAGYPGWRTFHPSPAPDPLHDDPGLYRNLLFLCQYSSSLFFPEHPACRGDGLWLAGSSPIHRRGLRGTGRFPVPPSSPPGNAAAGFGGGIWRCHDHFRIIQPVHGHLSGARANGRSGLCQYHHPQYDPTVEYTRLLCAAG